MKAFWFGSGLILGLTSLSLAYGATRSGNAQWGETAVVDPVNEIRAHKEPLPRFDSDLQRLSRMEARYHENVLVKAPLKRISSRQYSRGSKRRLARNSRVSILDRD